MSHYINCMKNPVRSVAWSNLDPQKIRLLPEREASILPPKRFDETSLHTRRLLPGPEIVHRERWNSGVFILMNRRVLSIPN